MGRAVLADRCASQILERIAHGEFRVRTIEHSFSHYFRTAKRNDAPSWKNAREKLRAKLLGLSRHRNVMNINAYGRQIKIV
ncbi:hypothetical protein [Dermabacter hominis]|uniref:hypothetical protein n=1 Tax=Dermabacter hominis TaxID=36740 RepID=UPI0021A361CA|nr:hypothetical protein [Dermabacter hominis]MCT1788868.1 hypothetical protein [Dermabacter hominis]